MTPRQQRFVAAYLISGNATQAAKDAGYSERTAEQQGCRLLKNAQVKAELARRQAIRAERAEIKADRVLQELARIGLSDARALFDADGRLLPPEDWPDDIARAVASFEVVLRRVPGSEPAEVAHVAKVRFWDKPAALNLLGKHLGMFVERSESVNINLTADLSADERRALRRALEVVDARATGGSAG